VCLALHPQNLDFWKIAAYNEYENNFNSSNARNFFQKSLRINKNNLNAYLDYFTFELKFVQKINERKSLLEGKPEEKLTFQNEPLKKNKEPKPSILEESDEVLKLKIPQMIFNQTLEHFKTQNFKISKSDICIKFLSTLMKHTKYNPNYKSLKKRIVEELKSCFSEKETLAFHIIIKSVLLDKYEEREYIKKALEKFKKLIVDYNSEKTAANIILSALIDLLQNMINSIEQNKLENENKEKLNDYIISQISLLINDEEIIKHPIQSDNARIYFYLLENSLFAQKRSQVKLLDEENIETIITNVLSNKENKELIGKYLNSYWQYLLYARNKNAKECYHSLIQKVDFNRKECWYYNTILQALTQLIYEEFRTFSDNPVGNTEKLIEFIQTAKCEKSLECLEKSFGIILDLIFVTFY
jgi:hypothetical protein